MVTMKTVEIVAIVLLLSPLGFNGTGAGCGRSLTGDGAMGDLPGAGFDCGPVLTCDSAKQFCSVVLGGPAGTPPSYACVDVPDAIPRPTCESIPDVGAGCECATAEGGVTVTCTAP